MDSVTVREKTFLGRCGQCRTAARFLAMTTTRRAAGAYGRTVVSQLVAAPWGLARASEDGSVSVRCLCGGHARFAPIIGLETSTRCGAKCRHSVGQVCECSCQGANHGAGHAL